jgi:hypothetical protein
VPSRRRRPSDGVAFFAVAIEMRLRGALGVREAHLGRNEAPASRTSWRLGTGGRCPTAWDATRSVGPADTQPNSALERHVKALLITVAIKSGRFARRPRCRLEAVRVVETASP